LPLGVFDVSGDRGLGAFTFSEAVRKPFKPLLNRLAALLCTFSFNVGLEFSP
jgi:hypothetical protein